MKKQNGFTLIEMSIVLVLAGLMVGGILMGRDMVRATQMRAQIKQIENYKTAMMTFKTKYNAYPGDIRPEEAANFGFFQLAYTVNCGNNNGFILGSGLCEVLVFWRHLGEANLIDGTYGSGDQINNAGAPKIDGSTRTVQVLPMSKLRDTLFMAIYTDNQFNYFELSNLNIYTFGGYTTLTNSVGAPRGLSPVEAQNLDTKIDDGMPDTGLVVPVGASDWYAINQPALEGTTSGYCINTAVPAAYNVNINTIGEVPACGMRIRIQ